MDGSERTKRRDGVKAGILRRTFGKRFRLNAFAGADSDSVDAGELFWKPMSKEVLDQVWNQSKTNLDWA